MVIECPSQESHFTFSITNQQDEDLREDVSKRWKETFPGRKAYDVLN
jgi:hypothetical protein